MGTAEWLPKARFAIEQGSQVRPIDDTSISGSVANFGAAMTEKLQLRGAAPRDDVVAWVLDESNARQIIVRQDHRRHTVLASTDPRKP